MRTKREIRQLAKAARSLASEFAEGRGPRLNPRDWCGCAAGETLRRAGMLPADRWNAISAAHNLDSGMLLTTATWLQEQGRDWSSGVKLGPPVMGAVVFPLLALADELEAGASV